MDSVEEAFSGCGQRLCKDPEAGRASGCICEYAGLSGGRAEMGRGTRWSQVVKSMPEPTGLSGHAEMFRPYQKITGPSKILCGARLPGLRALGLGVGESLWPPAPVVWSLGPVG